jgi:hypothetical protein
MYTQHDSSSTRAVIAAADDITDMKNQLHRPR